MKKARIVVHYGCMASEKSLALIQDYRKSRSVDEVCLCYVPANSKDGPYIRSRFMEGEGDENLPDIKIPATPVESAKDIYESVEKRLKDHYEFARQNGIVIARLRVNAIIDEISLFDDEIKQVIEDLAHNGVRVVCSGLDTDYRGEPFPLRGNNNETVPNIIGIASEKYQHFARCAFLLEDGAPCGNNATRSQRFRDTEHREPSHYTDTTIEVDPRKYVPVCEEHHRVPGKHHKMF